MPKVLSRIADFFRSKNFYRLILVLFVVEAAWIAVSAAYPQAFDENFHFGLIKVYSHYWLPFFSQQPPHADAYGAVARDPSYLYHYLMSFPYRLIKLFFKEQLGQIIILRFINIAMFTAGIMLFRKLLIRAGSSNALTNFILMLFILIPIVPQLAAQINYDNMMIPLTAALLLYAFKIMDQIKARAISIWSIVMFIGLCLLTSLVKYAFLPIFAGMVMYLLAITYKTYKSELKQIFVQLGRSWSKQKAIAKIFIVLVAIVPLGMFAQRDIGNLIMYQAIEPNCARVLSVKQCMAYSPWAYNYKNHKEVLSNQVSLSSSNPVIYAFQWVYWMWYRLFFAVNGPKSHFKNYPPLPLPSAATLFLSVAGIISLIKWRRKIFQGNVYLKMLFVVSACYLIALMVQGYYTYRYTAVLENMNGRYLLPILLLAAVILGQALSYSMNKSQTRKMVIAVVVLLAFIEGGGFLTFIARSDSSWYIPNKTIVKVNDTARKVIKHVVVKGNKTYGTPYWFFN